MLEQSRRDLPAVLAKKLCLERKLPMLPETERRLAGLAAACSGGMLLPLQNAHLSEKFYLILMSLLYEQHW